MPSKITKVAFWFSDFLAGLIGVLCVAYGLAMPIALPIYQKMNKLEQSGPVNTNLISPSLTFFVITSSILFLTAYVAYKVTDHSVSAVLVFSAIILGHSLYISNWLTLALVLPVIWLPYGLVYKELINSLD